MGIQHKNEPSVGRGCATTLPSVTRTIDSQRERVSLEEEISAARTIDDIQTRSTSEAAWIHRSTLRHAKATPSLGTKITRETR